DVKTLASIAPPSISPSPLVALKIGTRFVVIVRNPHGSSFSRALDHSPMFALLSCLKRPWRVQSRCIPRVLEGRHVLGIDETGSGKTAALALPILHRLSEHLFGVFALVVTPTRELAFQLPEQFRALGSCLHLRIAVVVGGMDMLQQTKELAARPHVVIATPGKIKALLENPDIPLVFARTKFLVLDEVDRVLDVSFQEELKFIFKCLPENRQNLFFSATTTSNLQSCLS
ncbi:hypothetical protein S245_041065, partial [Arachis hypogaea]